MTDFKKPFKYIKYYELITMIHLLLIEKTQIQHVQIVLIKSFKFACIQLQLNQTQSDEKNICLPVEPFFESLN